MKRWQALGEVEDSEDDELSVDDSPSPEPPRKRQKQSQDSTSARSQNATTTKIRSQERSQEEVDTEAWIRPKVATKIYGRRTNPPKQSSPVIASTDAKGNPQGPFLGTRRVPSLPSSPPLIADHEREATEPLPNTPSREADRQTVTWGADDEIGISSPNDSRTFHNAFPNNNASDDGHPQELPDEAPTPHFSKLLPLSASTPVLSSPLSERELSPVVAIRRLPPGSTNFAVEVHVEQERNTDASNAQAAVIEGFEPSASTAVARRNLRNRKPEQLNPYQVERMRYLQQCRMRGVRPVKYVEEKVDNDASPVASQSSQDQQEGDGLVQSSSPPRDHGGETGNTYPSLNYFSMLNSSSEDELGDIAHRKKRLKTSSAVRKARTRPASDQDDQFAVPLSPPRTSSGRSTPGEMALSRNSRRTGSGFKLPPGWTPAALPTPQISSETRRISGSKSSSSQSETRVRGQRNQRRSTVISVASNSHSSGSDDDSEAEEPQLRREQKRIRGVLPASWLKLDLRVQANKSRASPKRHVPRALSPRTSPQKGVARQVRRASVPIRETTDFSFLGCDESDSDQSVQAIPPMLEPSPKQRIPARSTILTVEDLDDDPMENDFIDPMLAGGTSRTGKRRRSFGRQPRITEAFVQSSTKHNDFSEERIGNRTRMPSANLRRRKKNTTRLPQQPRRSQVRLSIADSLRSPSVDETELPSFLKLALRRARQSKDLGRHSPTHKHIRLATAEDTEDATSILRAWRSGSIAPRSNNDFLAPPSSRQWKQQRMPLTELSSNRQQQRSGSPISKQKTIARSQPVIRSAQMRQPRLQVLRQEQPPQRPKADEGSEVRQRKPRRPRPRPGMQRLRGAQLETLERDFDADHRTAVFERRMQCLTENVALPVRKARTTGVGIDRFLQETEFGYIDANQQHARDGREQLHPTLAHRPRKHAPHRLDVDGHDFQQTNQPVSEDGVDDINDLGEAVGNAEVVLQGLGQFGTSYPVDFGVRPLPPGVHFHASTLLGSHDFRNALALGTRDTDQSNGHMRIQLNDSIHKWSAWTEEVATQFSSLPKAAKLALKTLEEVTIGLPEQRALVDRNIDYVLRSAVRYLSSCLYFIDPIDRQSCVERLERVIVELSDVVAECALDGSLENSTAIRLRQYQLILAGQTQQLCNHQSIPHGLRKRIDELLLHVARSLAKEAIVNRLEELPAFYECLLKDEVRRAGIRDDSWAVSSLVILNHILRGSHGYDSLFWQVVDVTCNLEVSKPCAINEMENVWRAVFLILPVLEIDNAGISSTGSRLSQTQENWTAVRLLISRTLDLYDASSRIRGFTVNNYVRTLLSRAHRLVNEWGWWKCGPMLNAVYDFFAQRNLGLLRNEEGHGSPKFLEELDGNPSFEILPDDRSFHIFLKLTASAILGMRKHKIYRDSKITGVAWRLLPNHSRTCRKDADLQRSELEALRNHYDLLCTLYFAMPPGHRISVDIPKSLVNQADSHREACRLSVRAWANMTSFQMSTNEPLEALEPMIAWFTDILKINMSQFRLARTEAERDKQEAEKDGILVNHSYLETLVAKNQTEIAKTIVDALAGLKRALASASRLETASTLLASTRFWSVYELFDPSQHRLISAMLEALRLVETALDVERRFAQASADPEDSSEESQDFGDSSALQEYVAGELPNDRTTTKPSEILLQPMSHFVSNVFGADASSDDALLEKLVHVWARLAGTMVQNHGSTWSQYVDEYSTTSWSQMRDTMQKRKFQPFFVAKVVEQSSADGDVVQLVISTWILSLVEREGMLKFQHILTATLLNHCPTEPILHNLPFAHDQRTGKFDISLHDVRQRRIALISALLCNMRKEFDETLAFRPARKDELQSTYRSMLRRLMQAMKTNYQELQAAGSREVAETNVQGAYVDFVQQIVSLLQQHVSGICQVDRFFTDSAAFPLPATDPTYVVGRLRSYIPKLGESRTRTQLAVFIQTVSERAATDGQQHYLAQQLVAAMQDGREHGRQESPTLRHVMLTSIIPAYVENAFSAVAAWILALPMLDACEQIIQDAVCDVQIEEDSSVIAATEIMSSLLGAIFQLCETASLEYGQLLLPHVLKILSKSIGLARASLTLISFIRRSGSHGGELARVLELLYHRVVALRSRLINPDELVDVDYDSPAPASTPWPDTKFQAEKQMRDALTASWSCSDGRYWVRRGNASKEVAVELNDVNEERSNLLQAITEFCSVYESTSYPRSRRSRVSRGGDMLGSLII